MNGSGSFNAEVSVGFWAEVAELNALVQAKAKEGHGAESMREAQRELAERPRPLGRNEVPRSNRKKAFFFSFIFGALWGGTRRR